MNTRQKFTVVALLSSFALVSNPAKADVLGFSVAMPEIGAVTAEVGKIVAADLTATLRNALTAPRITRKRQSPTVSIQEMDAATIETVTVVATRLPPTAATQVAHTGTRTRL
jgi:hypothetical protein